MSNHPIRSKGLKRVDNEGAIVGRDYLARPNSHARTWIGLEKNPCSIGQEQDRQPLLISYNSKAWINRIWLPILLVVS